MRVHKAKNAALHLVLLIKLKIESTFGVEGFNKFFVGIGHGCVGQGNTPLLKKISGFLGTIKRHLTAVEPVRARAAGRRIRSLRVPAGSGVGAVEGGCAAASAVGGSSSKKSNWMSSSGGSIPMPNLAGRSAAKGLLLGAK